MVSDSCRKLLILQNLKGIGTTTMLKLAEKPNFASLSFDQLKYSSPRLKRAIKESGALDAARVAADKEIAVSKEYGVRICCFLDKDYPVLLNETADKPAVIFSKGEWTEDQGRSVAVIGTKEPTEHGKIIAERITSYLAGDKWSIVSGLALGCDTAAHYTALREKAHTVAVVAHGLKTVAPAQNRELAKMILDNGGILVSEYNFETNPNPYQYIARDRIQAGLSRGVVMVQSKINGGSLHASRSSIKYGRILAVPRPTEKDLVNHTETVQANIILTSDDNQEKKVLLKCNEADLERLLVLKDSGDYQKLSICLESPTE